MTVELDIPISPGPGEWTALAACADVDPVAFTGAKPPPEDLDAAARVCAACPVARECAAYATEHVAWGLWAGRWYDGRRHKSA